MIPFQVKLKAFMGSAFDFETICITPGTERKSILDVCQVTSDFQFIFLSFRGILFLILKSFHSTPTHQSLSWAFWNESCGQRNQPEALHPQTSTPNVASPTEDCGGCKGQKPGAQEGGSRPNLLWSREYYLVLLNSGFKYQLLFLCIFLKYAWHTLMQENLSLHMCLGWSLQFDLFSSFPP